MEPNIKEVAGRIRALREDSELTMQEMADATGGQWLNMPLKSQETRIYPSRSFINAPRNSVWTSLSFSPERPLI